MKKIILVLLCTILSFSLKAQGLIGAWQSLSTDKSGEKVKSVLIVADGYHALSVYHATTGKFIKSSGGLWSLNGNTLTEKLEFNTDSTALVGTERIMKLNISENTFEIIGTDMQFTRIDKGMPGALKGAWLMSGRVVADKEQTRDTSGPRKTMKILSGTRFQWIAYNTATKEFLGTGGGTYTTLNGEYTENIEFFSRDNTRAGVSLKFNYKLVDLKWQHSGLSSKGDPINEIWSVRK